jgi:hypothetical protein
MLKTLRRKVSRFAALHPQAVMHGIIVGVTLGIALAASFAMNPDDASAQGGSSMSFGASNRSE